MNISLFYVISAILSIYRDILSMYLHKPTQYMNVLEKFEEKIIKKWKISVIKLLKISHIYPKIN